MMKLYRAKIPTIAADVVDRLVADEDIEIDPERRDEAIQDLVAIMEEFLRRSTDLRNRIRDYMAARRIPYDEYGQVRKKMAEEWEVPQGEDIERFLARQFIENMMISPNVEEVFGEDGPMYKKVIEIIRSHDVDERAIRDEAEGRIKNVQEGTVDYELALEEAVRDVKKRRGLL